MPNRRFDWHEHIQDIEGEFWAARIALDRLKAQAASTPELFRKIGPTRPRLQDADRNLEGTYIVRLFAAFEAALRSYDRARHKDPTRETSASVLIDSTGMLLSVWTQTYFRSKACVAEFETFRRRGELSGAARILPVLYHGGDHFPDEARSIQAADFRNYAIAGDIPKYSALSAEFSSAVKRLAVDAARVIISAPPLDPTWPIVEPKEIQPRAQPAIPKL
jgi:hypothetical protein